MDVTELYDDCARSGGSIMGRDGLLRLMDRARDRVIIVEALDRLSRDMEDLAGIHKRLSFLGLEIGGVHEALVSTVLVRLPWEKDRDDNVVQRKRRHFANGAIVACRRAWFVGQRAQEKKAPAINPFSRMGLEAPAPRCAFQTIVITDSRRS
jgi:hypothetical protein